MIVIINLKKVNITLLKIALFLAPFSVSDKFNYLFTSISFSLIIIVIAGYISIINIISTRKFNFKKDQKKILLLIILPIILSIMSALFFYVYYKEPNYIEFFRDKFFSRLILLILNLSVFMNLFIITNEDKNIFKELIKSYFYGIVVLVFFGLWQLFSFSFNLPFLDLGTRTHVHGIDKNINLLFNFRITSLANEPSYLAPFMIDIFLIGFLFIYSDKYNKKYKDKVKLVQMISIVLLLFTFSSGGYINFFILIIAMFVLYKDNVKKDMLPYIYGGILLFIPILLFYHEKVFSLFAPVLGRLSNIFNINQQIRMFMSIMPFKWVLEHNILNGLFGYGLNSYKYLSRIKILPSGYSVHVTSNNLFADSVYEIGYFGLYCIIFVIILLIKQYYKSEKKIENKLGIAILIHLILTSLYRADYMQIRFWFLLYSVSYLISYNIKKA